MSALIRCDRWSEVIACLAAAFLLANGLALSQAVAAESDLVLRLDGPVLPRTPGDRFSYEFSVSNRGPTEATGTLLTVSLSAAARLVAADASQGTWLLKNGPLAPGGFAPRIDSPTGTSPRSVGIADFDGDGRPDLAVANAGGGTISVLRNVSMTSDLNAASLVSAFQLAAADTPYHLAVGDIDRDGWPDIAVAERGASFCSVFRNRGLGAPLTAASFAARVDLPANSAPHHVVIGDLDGDGRPELVVANLGAAAVSVFRNLGAPGLLTPASFAPRVDFPVGSRSFAVAMGDLDGDRKPDLAVAGSDSRLVSLLRNTSVGGRLDSTSFAPSVDLNVGGSLFGIAIGDLDGDGRADIAIANIGRGSVSILRNIGTVGSIQPQSFAVPVHIPTGSSAFGVAISLVDGDNKPDLLVANQGANTLTVLGNATSPGAITPQSFAPRLDLPTGRGPFIGLSHDLNGDSLPDLVVVNDGDNTVSVFANRSCFLCGELELGAISAGAMVTASLLIEAKTVGMLTNVATVRSAAVGPNLENNDAISVVRVAGLDFGDAPLPFPTLLASNGAFHYILPGFYLGAGLDAEADASPNAVATGDDLNGDDEDGVTLPSSLSPGGTATVRVVASSNGWLNAWIDFNGNGSWSDAGEQVFSGQPLMAGPNVLTFAVPATAMGQPGGNAARWRFSSEPQLTFAGPALDGEVEDNLAEIFDPAGRFDFGDAPGEGYGTRLVNNGARHSLVAGVHLGRGVDAETDGRPSALADGDDIAGPALDDEDGVIFVSPLAPGHNAMIQVVASVAGFLNAWLDFKANGTWTDPNDAILVNQPVAPGTNTLSFGVPGDVAPTNTFARFRFSTAGFLTHDGPAADGEVEDYAVTVLPTADLRLTKRTVRAVRVQSEFAYLLSVENRGPYPAMDVQVFDPLPGGMALVAVDAASASVQVEGESLSTNSLAARVAFAVGDKPESVAVGDLNQDGLPELVTANEGGNALSILANRSSGSLNAGSFAPAFSLPTGNKPRSVAVADFDGDTRLDLAAANENDRTVSVLRNVSKGGTLGPNTFSAKVDFVVGDKPARVAAADLDGDGRPELIVANQGDNTLSVLPNRSTAGVLNPSSFGTTMNFDAGLDPAGLGIGDLDGDGRLDVTIANGVAGTVSVLRNTSGVSGTQEISFAPRFTLTTGNEPVAVVLADIDGDRAMDLVTANSGAGTISIFRRVGAGEVFNASSFATRVDLLLPAGSDPHAITTADLDADGKPEMVVANTGTATVSVFRNVSAPGNLAANSFVGPISFPAERESRSLAAADLDHDGFPDLALTSLADHRVSVFRNSNRPLAVRLRYGALSVGESVSASLRVRAGRIGLLTNIAGASSATLDLFPDDNLAAAVIQVALVQPPTILAPVRMGTNVVLSWSSEPGSRYVLEFKNDLNETLWSAGSAVTATGTVATVEDVFMTPRRFYRVRTP